MTQMGKVKQPHRESSLLIIGAGTFGTSLAVHASKACAGGSHITIIDRWSPDASVHDKNAAAVDINRIIRTDYASPLYSRLAHEAIHFWSWGMEYQGHFHKAGWVVFDGPEHDDSFRKHVQQTAEERGSNAVELVDLKEFINKHEILSGLSKERMGDSYRNPKAGWVNAANATKAYLRIAESRGVRRVTGEVEELLMHDDGTGLKGVRLHDGTTLEADRVVIAAGAWTSSLLSPLEDRLNIAHKDRIERQVTAVGRLSAYYKLSEGEVMEMMEAKLPIIVLGRELDIIPPFFHIPYLKVNDLKTEFTNTVTTGSGQQMTAPDIRHQKQVPSELVRRSEKIIKSNLPDWAQSRTPEHWRICYDAVTPTEDWVLSQHPDGRLKNMFVAVGGSFHSYKFLPVAGKYLLNVLNGRSNGEEMDQAWKWKDETELRQKSAKEFGQSPQSLNRLDLQDMKRKTRL